MVSSEISSLLSMAIANGQDRTERRLLRIYEDPIKLEGDIAVLERTFADTIDDREVAKYLLGEFGGNVRQTIHFLNWVTSSPEEVRCLMGCKYDMADIAWVYRQNVGQEIFEVSDRAQLDGYRDNPESSEHYLEHRLTRGLD